MQSQFINNKAFRIPYEIRNYNGKEKTKGIIKSQSKGIIKISKVL